MSLVPVGVYAFATGGRPAGMLTPVYVGAPACFVAAVTAWRVGEELLRPRRPPMTDEGPRGVLTQAEAAERFDELILGFWERDQC